MSGGDGRPRVIDMTRLVDALTRGAPTGIDRVDYAYAWHALGGEDGGGRNTGSGLIVTVTGPRHIARPRARRIVGSVRRRWGERGDRPDQDLLGRVARHAAGPPMPWPFPSDERATSGARARAGGITRLAMHHAAPIGLRPRLTVPQGAVYLHTSHVGLDRDRYTSWLDRRPDVRPVFFLHDLIPLAFPEYASPGGAARHAARVRTMLGRASLFIVNSQAVADDLVAHADREGLRAPAVVVAPLGVEDAFIQAARTAPGRPAPAPYFLMCGTIEPRKNHQMLLQIWRRFVEEGRQPPRLVLVGRRGWENENIVDLLDRCPAVRNHVIELSNISTATLAALMRGAAAVLMPSFAEGYGMPLAEALATGAPVIASDLPAHREVAGQAAVFLDPLDALGWKAAIEELWHPGSPAAERARARSRDYAPPVWDDHFRIADEAIDAL